MNGSGWTEQDKENENIRDNAAFNASHAVQKNRKRKTEKRRNARSYGNV